jgi:hypothetical protein
MYVDIWAIDLFRESATGVLRTEREVHRYRKIASSSAPQIARKHFVVTNSRFRNEQK